MKPRWVDGIIFWGPTVHCVRFDNRKAAQRLVNHFMVRGYPFVYEQEEGYHDIFIGEAHNLERIRERFSPAEICV